MNTHDQHRLERFNRRLLELRAWRNAREATVEEWTFTPPGGTSTPLRLGDRWPTEEFPVTLRARATVPAAWAGQPVELELWLGGEGFVRLSNGVAGGLNPAHRTFVVADAARGGESVEIEAEVVPKGIFGSHIPGPGLDSARLVVPETEVRALERDLAMIVEAAKVLDEHEAVPRLLDIVDAALATLAPAWPSDTETVLTRIIGERGGGPSGGYGWMFLEETGYANPIASNMGLWSLPSAPAELGPLPEPARDAVRRARQVVADRLAAVGALYPPVGAVALSGHAHIDLAWLWPIAETRRKVRRTFHTQLGLLDAHPEFRFNQSSAQAYAWMEEDDPELWRRIKERVAEGRWEPVGGQWCESDANITGGESFVRQHLYGQRYFEQKFGARHTVSWFPDVFGYSAAMPQLLKGCGIEDFFTIKISWNETNELPYDLFWWEGIDGTRILTHMFRNPGAGYNGNVSPNDALGTWRNFRQKDRHTETLLTVGWGDGGGGPSERMLQNYERLREFPALPRLRWTRVDELFASFPREGIPRWVGELYLEFHRGTLTTQATTKALNRQAEHRLLEAEAFSALAGVRGMPYPREELEAAWKTLLLNQFHDILPGSSIREVYEDNHRDVSGVVETAARHRDAALAYLAARAAGEGEGRRVLVANAALEARPLSVVLPGIETVVTVVDEHGAALPTQQVAGGLLVHAPEWLVPGVGYTTLRLRPSASPPEDAEFVSAVPTDDGGALIESGELRIRIGADGTLHSVWDVRVERETLQDRGNQLWAYVDKPRVFDAWDIDEDYELEAEEIGGVESVEVVEEGPLRAAVRVTRAWRSSRIVQEYVLHAGSMRLDIRTRIDLHDRQVLVRALFPLAIRSHEATYETMYGALRRPTHRNTSWDAAKFEVCGHRFADMSEPGYGVALLNDGKYGHSARDNVLGLSLVRSPIYPDLQADEGDHAFTYSLLPHLLDWTDGEVVSEAFGLNSPLVATVADGPGTGEGEPEVSLVSSPVTAGLLLEAGIPLAIGAVKRAEDDDALIVRAYEPYGARGTAALEFARAVRSAVRTTMLEDPVEDDRPLVIEENAVAFEVRPFEVVTLRVEL